MRGDTAPLSSPSSSRRLAHSRASVLPFPRAGWLIRPSGRPLPPAVGWLIHASACSLFPAQRLIHAQHAPFLRTATHSRAACPLPPHSDSFTRSVPPFLRFLQPQAGSFARQGVLPSFLPFPPRSGSFTRQRALLPLRLDVRAHYF